MTLLVLTVISKGTDRFRKIDMDINHLLVFSVTKKLTQFFYNDILEGDRNRLAENLIVGPQSRKSKDRSVTLTSP